jgi:hypothetical protein
VVLILRRTLGGRRIPYNSLNILSKLSFQVPARRYATASVLNRRWDPGVRVGKILLSEQAAIAKLPG